MIIYYDLEYYLIYPIKLYFFQEEKLFIIELGEFTNIALN